ncbi:MAG: TatD family hydrolase [Candidatus Tectomicrobia bacterium]|nr:TatD family hydrolase [Candidatus Tectomicrobia bacterium]
MEHLTDYHVHLPHYEKEAVPGVLERARRAGVGRVVTLGMDLEESRASVELAEAHSGVYAGVGVHPWRASRPLPQEEVAAFRALASKKCVVAIGEVGIDRYGSGVVGGVLNRGNAFPLDVQRAVLRQMIQLAREVGKPLVLHGRMSYRELLDFLRAEKVGAPGGVRGVVHDFTGEEETALGLLAQGLYLSVTGAVTRPDSECLKGVVRKIPLDRLLLETDSPARQSISHMNERNEPAFLTETVETLASVYGLSAEEIALRTEENLHRFLGLS